MRPSGQEHPVARSILEVHWCSHPVSQHRRLLVRFEESIGPKFLSLPAFRHRTVSVSCSSATRCIHQCSSRLDRSTVCSWPQGGFGVWFLGSSPRSLGIRQFRAAGAALVYTKNQRETTNKPIHQSLPGDQEHPRRALVYSSRCPTSTIAGPI